MWFYFCAILLVCCLLLKCIFLYFSLNLKISIMALSRNLWVTAIFSVPAYNLSVSTIVMAFLLSIHSLHTYHYNWHYLLSYSLLLCWQCLVEVLSLQELLLYFYKCLFNTWSIAKLNVGFFVESQIPALSKVSKQSIAFPPGYCELQPGSGKA